MAWIVEKFRTWSDCGGDVESRFSKDELLTNISLYWFNANITSSARLYYETMGPFAKNTFHRGRVKVALCMPSNSPILFTALELLPLSSPSPFAKNNFHRGRVKVRPCMAAFLPSMEVRAPEL